jgi:hypothetical protein
MSGFPRGHNWGSYSGDLHHGLMNRRFFMAQVAGLLSAGWLAPPGLRAATPAHAPVRSRSGPRRPGNTDQVWMSAKGLCAFPLAADEIPRTGAELAESMLGGWSSVFTFQRKEGVIEFSGGRYPAVDSLFIDLTNAVTKRPSGKPLLIPAPVPTTRSIGVARFTMLGDPIISEGARINLKVTGKDVRFDLQHDKSGRPVLMLADAKAGTVQFDLTHKDLERLMLARARIQMQSLAVIVRNLNLSLVSDGPRALVAEVYVSTLVGLIPAGIRFTSRVDIDDRMIARISNLSVVGDEALGPLIVGLIRPGMARYEGKVRPLLSFPAGHLKLKNLELRAGDRVQLNASFAT